MLSYFPKSISSIIKKFNKSSIWFKTLSLIVLILILTSIFKVSPKEGFDPAGGKKFVTFGNEDLYDKFYTSIYDDLSYDAKKNSFEVRTIDRIAKIDKSSNVVDIGSGPGHHVKYYHSKGVKVQGLEKSKWMYARARTYDFNLKFKLGDVLRSDTYDADQFTHALCLYYTVYYIRDKKQFFKNVYDWLKPGGTLVLHLVNRNKFNPILPAGDPLVGGVSPQKFAKKRITTTLVKFNDFKYKADFKHKKGEDIAKLIETFTHDGTGHVRQNEHTLYMETQKNILSKAKEMGFILKGQVNMVEGECAYQYLYFLTKPE